MSTRHLDESALRCVIGICERPNQFVRGGSIVAVTLIEGFLLDKCSYRLTERLHQALSLPCNVSVWAAIRNQVENGSLDSPLQFIRSVAEDLLSENDSCICCGQVIADDDSIQIANQDCVSRIPKYGVRFAHTSCCVESKWPNSWAMCCRCADAIPKADVIDASEKLLQNLSRPSSIEYRSCCFALATVDFETYWDVLEANERGEGTIGDQYRAVRDAHLRLALTTHDDMPGIPTKIRNAFLPAHVNCAVNRRTMA